MIPLWEESEFVFCDLQAAARHIRRSNPAVLHAFLEAAYGTFEFLARNPGAGRGAHLRSGSEQLISLRPRCTPVSRIKLF